MAGLLAVGSHSLSQFLYSNHGSVVHYERYVFRLLSLKSASSRNSARLSRQKLSCQKMSDDYKRNKKHEREFQMDVKRICLSMMYVKLRRK